LTSTRYFKVHGTQNYGVTNFDNYAGGTTTYVIPVGSFYTGAMDRLVFINDNDSGSGNTSTFSNVKIYEGSCGGALLTESIANREAVTPLLGTDDELSAFDLGIFPNPTNDVFSLQVNNNIKGDVNAIIYTILGSKKVQIKLSSGSNKLSTRSIGLPSGIYLVKIENQGSVLSTQKLIVN